MQLQSQWSEEHKEIFSSPHPAFPFPAHDSSPRLRQCLCGNQGAEPDCSIQQSSLSCSCCQVVWDSEDTVVNLYTVFFREQTEKTRSVLWSLFLLIHSSFQGLILEFSTLLIFHKDSQVFNALRLPQFPVQLCVRKKLFYFIGMHSCCGLNSFGPVLTQSFDLKCFYLWARLLKSEAGMVGSASEPQFFWTAPLLFNTS